MMKLEIESAKVDEKVFNGIVYRKHNGTNFYLTDDEDGMYLVKGSD